VSLGEGSEPHHPHDHRDTRADRARTDSLFQLIGQGVARYSSVRVTLGIVTILLAVAWTATPAGAEEAPSPTLGIALGGVRLAAIEAPIALDSEKNPGSAFCVLYRTPQPFDGAKPKALYPRQGVYFGAVLRAVVEDLEGRCVTLAAADVKSAETGLSDVPPAPVGRPQDPEAPSRP
jgi:hypothetical protein